MTHTMASSRPNSVDQDSVTLMSQCLNTAAKEIQIRAQVIFSSEGLQNAQVQKLLEADGAAFRWANVYGLGASVSSGALCFYMSRSWWLAARVPFVGFTSLLCGPAGYLDGRLAAQRHTNALRRSEGSLSFSREAAALHGRLEMQ